MARFTAQLVALVYPDRKDRVVRLTKTYGVSQATIMRAIVDEGLPRLEERLAGGDLDPSTLA